MSLFIIILILSFWVGVSYVISTFFEDREIGKESVFWLSVILSPLIGILIGISSKRVEKKTKKVIPNYKSKSYKLNKEKNEIEKRLKEIKNHKDLGIKEVDDEEIEKIKKRYLEIESELEKHNQQKKNLEKFGKRSFRKRNW